MKQFFCIVFALLSVIHSKAQGGFQINGHIDGGLEGMKVSLRYGSIHYNEGKDVLDRAVLHDGNFLLKGKLGSTAFCTILFENPVQQGPNKTKVLSLFVENATISVQALYDSLPLKEIWGVPVYNRLGIPDVLNAGSGISRSAVIKGSASHDLLMQFMNASWQLVQKEKSVGDFIHIIDGGVPAVKALDSALNDIRDFTFRFVGSHPPGEVTAFVALYALYGGFLRSDCTSDILDCTTGKDIEQLTAPFAAMEHKGLLVRQLLQKAPAVAKVVLRSRFIDIMMTDTNGVKHPLHDFVGKGRYVLVDMWASWCHACRAAIPHLKESYAAYHPRGLDVITVSVDANKADWIKAVKEAMPWQQLASNLMTDGDMKKFGGMGDYEASFSPSNIRAAYMFGGVPVVLLFDPQGKLIARSFGSPVALTDKILDDLYGGAPSPDKQH